MTKLTVNWKHQIGDIKAMHGVGQPPFSGTDFSMVHYLKEAGIPYSRLHDVGGYYGQNRFVDIPNIFRDFSADPYDPNSYDFTFTDCLIKALNDNNVEPFFRLGVTIENEALIKSYRLDPPADNLKWAKICEGIIRHYTEGWADGFTYNIKYWEIWNEPDNDENINENCMWKGTKEQYFELYDVASKHLKKCFPSLKIGGYASCGFYAINNGKQAVKAANSSSKVDYFIEFFTEFLKYIKQHDCPLDFFSWHSYDNIENNIKYANYARCRLDEFGYFDTETICNEWNSEVSQRGTVRHAALTEGMMLAFQNTPLDSAMFYDARYGVSIYGSLFNPLTAEPFPAYYSFVAYNELYKRQKQVELQTDNDGLYAVAAYDGISGFVLISNPTQDNISIDFCLNGNVTECKIINEKYIMEKCSLPSQIEKESVLCVWVNPEEARK